MERLTQDLTFAARLLWKDRAFTLTTVATLAICVAANAAIFAVIHAVLLRPLPFPEPERLVIINNSYPGAGAVVASNGVPDYFDRLAQTTVFEELAMYRETGATLGGQGSGDVERVTSMAATPSLFRLLRAAPHMGRPFEERDTEAGQERKVILSYGLWQQRFGGADTVLAQELRINGVPHAIVGVMPRGFRFVDPDVQLWTVAAFAPADRGDDRRHSNSWQQLGRLRPDARIEQARTQIDAINAANFERFPQLQEVLRNVGFRTVVDGFEASLVEGSRRTLLLLWGGVLCVLLIGAVNIANLVSIRATARARELATRHALGASLQRLSRQILTETLVTAAVGGVAGLVLGWWGLQAASLLGLDQLPRGDEIAFTWQTVAFTALLTVGVGLVVGLLPVLSLRRANLGQIVREEGRGGTASRRTRVVRRALVASQVTFAVVLLVGAGVLLASFQRVLAVHPGFDEQGVLTGHVSLPATRYQDAAALRTAADAILDRVRAVPGVESAGFTTTLPVSGQHNDSVILADGYQMAPGESLISPSQVHVTPGYFETMRTRLVAGRSFDARDGRGQPRTIIVDEQLARKFWSGQNPLGRYLYFPGDVSTVMEPPPRDQWMEVVGVVENVRLDGIVDGASFKTVGAYYLPIGTQTTRTLALAVRTSQPPTAVTNDIRAAIRGVDAELPFYTVRAMHEQVARALVDRRTPMLLAVGFAATALLLAAVGIYGMLAYQVSQRAREIGIRMALGAGTHTIFAMVMREGALTVAVGIVAGLGGAWLLRSVIASQLYETGAMEPTVVGIVAVVLLSVAVVACLVPARKAARTDPAIALTE